MGSDIKKTYDSDKTCINSIICVLVLHLCHTIYISYVCECFVTINNMCMFIPLELESETQNRR